MKAILKPNYEILIQSACYALQTEYEAYKKAQIKLINSTYYIGGSFVYPEWIDELSDDVKKHGNEVIRLKFEIDRLTKEKEAFG